MEARKRGRPRGEQIKSCACGYVTENKGNFWKHRQICSYVVDGEKDQLRERVASLEAQVAADREQLAIKDEQLAANDAQMKEKEDRIVALEQMLGHQLLEVKEELKQTKKRKDRYADVAATRRPRSEPERRKIAQAQGWRCADPDGGCLLPGELQEYDIDHVTPIWKGGLDEPDNMQALCPACHRRKTPPVKLVGERSIGTLPDVGTPEPGG